MKPSRVIAGCACLALLAGCAASGAQTGRGTNLVASPRQYLQYAGASGPVLVLPSSNPFPVPAQVVAEAAAEGFNDSLARYYARFTSDPAVAGQPGYRVMLNFDPPPGVPSSRVACAPPVLAQEVGRPVEREDGYIPVVAGFCYEGGALSFTRGRLAADTLPGDRTYRTFMQQLAYELFLPDDTRDDDRWSPWLFPSLGVGVGVGSGGSTRVGVGAGIGLGF
jgi:hypothetical protein